MINPIIPSKNIFYKIPVPREPDLEAICIFTALGFFLGSDTYWRNEKVLLAGHSYQNDDAGNIIPGKKMFEWFYEPREVPFDNAVEEFAELFADITREQVQGKDVILPLSGGLDSRSQAVVLKDIGYDRVKTYSYAFADSFNETSYGRKIAQKCGFEFLDLTIPEGYLWNKIDALSDINQCYSDFTHPRQMAVLEEIAPLGDIFHLGHWGDVLFDDMGVADDASEEEQFKYLKHKILKKGGRELAGELWKAWGLPGLFEVYLDNRLRELFEEIKIENANARIRAFKSLYWAPRWTSVNLEVFSSIHPLALPYYDDRMCRFICTVPEQFLAARKMQIEYIKRKAPEVAAIPWQSFSPCNLYNYGSFKSFKYYPYRLLRKTDQIWKEKIQGKRITTRNWEIQFKGSTNDQNLKNHLFAENSLSRLVPEEITRKVYEAFKGKDEVYYSHPLSMLLTLSQFSKKYL
jgi:rhodanese-related sulfurtransferase